MDEALSGSIDLEGNLNVRLEVFEGPLDLLLHLIKSSKIDIYDIPIAQITAQYLEYLDLMQDLNLDVASEFMVMAATLAHIKSRMLLPVHQEGEEDEDPRRELVEQLLEYQRYREASEGLKEMLDRRSLVFSRSPEAGGAVREEVFMDVSLFQLLTVFRQVLSSSREGPGYTVAHDEYSIPDMMGRVMDALHRAEQVLFTDLFLPGACRQEVITTFLAILELVRMRAVRVAQMELAGPIHLTRGEAFTHGNG